MAKLGSQGIPTVKDRIVQTALKMVIEPIFEYKFLDTTNGYLDQVKGVTDTITRS